MLSLNNIILAVTGILIIWQIILLRKPFIITKGSLLRSVIMTPLMMIVYAFLLNASLLNPAAFYLLAAGLIVGTGYGLMTKVYLEDISIMARRSGFYIIFWGIIYLITHFLAEYLGSGGVTLGITLMMFSFGILLTQYGILAIKALAVRNKRLNQQSE